MKPMNVEYLMMDASILLPPTGTPLTGIDFVKRLPCGDVERTRRVSKTIFLTFVHDKMMPKALSNSRNTNIFLCKLLDWKLHP